MQTITFVTGNKAKAEQLSIYLAIPLLHHTLDLPEIQSLDLAEIVHSKTMAAYQILSTPVLVEDVGLSFEAYNKLPGTFIKWFLQELGNEGLCKMVEYTSRKALAQVLFGLYDGENYTTFFGETKGSISHTPKGEHGFGWDSLFIPDGSSKTWAEMDNQERSETSMRRGALQKLAKFLKEK